MAKRRTKGTGSLTLLKSGRWQARRPHPTEMMVVRGSGQLRPRMVARSFDSRTDAAGWLKQDDATAFADSPKVVAAVPKGKLPFKAYADTWLEQREVRPRTRSHYRTLLDNWLLPTFGATPLSGITPSMVREWYASKAGTADTMRAHAYTLLRGILGTAVDDDVIPTNPCRIRKGGQAEPTHRPQTATFEEIDVITKAMPARLQAAVQVSVWCAPRFGELTELRRKDVNLKAGTIRIARAVVHVDGEYVVGPPKSAAGKRVVRMPASLVPIVERHLEKFVDTAPDSLLFPAIHGGHLAPTTLYRSFYKARTAAGRPDLHWHDLRHTGATLTAATGTTLANTMQRLGHSTVGAAMRYQHAASDAETGIATALDDVMANAPQTWQDNVVPITKPRRRTASGK